jgi:hypothetical protein
VRSRAERVSRNWKTATNPQRRPVCSVAAGRRVPPREMPTAPGGL